MPYSKSQARIDFEESINKNRQLARDASLKKNKIKYEHKQSIYQSAIFQLCAQIEDYLKCFIEDLIYRYKTNGAIMSHLPSQFRTSQLIANQIGTYQSHLNQPNQFKILQKLDIDKPIYNVINSASTLTNEIRSATIISTNKYPSEKNLKKLFHRFGVKDIFQYLQSTYHQDYKIALKSFLDTRESIAHQTPPSLTYEDVKRNYENMKDFIGKLDRLFYKQVMKSGNQTYW